MPCTEQTSKETDMKKTIPKPRGGGDQVNEKVAEINSGMIFCQYKQDNEVMQGLMFMIEMRSIHLQFFLF